MSAPRPMSGRQLLGWIGGRPDSRTVFRRAQLLGRSRGYPSLILGWTAEQVADVFHELATKPAKGLRPWGGAAGSGHAAPK